MLQRPHPLVPAIVLVAVGLISCDTFLTREPEKGETFDQPLQGLTRAQQLAFARGDEAFEKVFSVREGLGPLFNQASCESCHSGDGKGHPRTNLIRFGRNLAGVFDPLYDDGGPQLQERSIPGAVPETIPAHANAISIRSGPIVFGLGFIEAIPDSVILQHADPTDRNNDGISGRPNMVIPPDWLEVPRRPHIGRFGRKASVAFLLQQVANAYHQDMGITSEFLPTENPHPQYGTLGDDVPDPEVSRATIEDVVAYLRMLAPPKRGPITPQVERGERLFTHIGCATCHVPTMKTGKHPTIAALSEVEVPLYSDLLLHDMGPQLADGIVEGEASGSEWRTTPLWGLRLLADHLGGTPFYLHDGRTSDLREVIQFHGGEAAQTRLRFFALSKEDQEALLAFLLSL
jgi:CxxC motif-containing protein (DUF1111 family)